MFVYIVDKIWWALESCWLTVHALQFEVCHSLFFRNLGKAFSLIVESHSIFSCVQILFHVHFVFQLMWVEMQIFNVQTIIQCMCRLFFFFLCFPFYKLILRGVSKWVDFERKLKFTLIIKYWCVGQALFLSFWSYNCWTKQKLCKTTFQLMYISFLSTNCYCSFPYFCMLLRCTKHSEGGRVGRYDHLVFILCLWTLLVLERNYFLIKTNCSMYQEDQMCIW